MPNDVENIDDSEEDNAIDEETIKNLTLPEPEPIQIKISTLHRMCRTYIR